MNYQRKPDPAQIEAAAEQRRRERAAPRLCQAAPALVSLRFKFEDLRSGTDVDGILYAKPIVVATAPAHFDLRCVEPRCDGRHDLTESIMAALRAKRPTFSGESPCNGLVAGESCSRTLYYSYEATYQID